MSSNSDCDSDGSGGDDWSTPLPSSSVLLSLSLSLCMLLALWFLLQITSRALVAFPLTPGDATNHAPLLLDDATELQEPPIMWFPGRVWCTAWELCDSAGGKDGMRPFSGSNLEKEERVVPDAVLRWQGFHCCSNSETEEHVDPDDVL